MRKRVVVSAVNFIEGGPLAVLRDCLGSAALSLPPEWEIIALVHDQKLVDQPRIRLVEVLDAKRSWFRRLYHEWIGFRRLSLKWQPDLWLSLHDITPRVEVRRQAVFCHNSASFYSLPWAEARLHPSFWLFNKFYKYLYRIFIHRNYYVIVQQDWLREAFTQLYGSLPIVVAYPSVNITVTETSPSVKAIVVFLYPTFPRVFKNIGTILEAAKLLSNLGVDGFELRITLSGSENAYARQLHARYSNVSGVRFIGLQNGAGMAKQYQESKVVLFPSKLETWGLPISEAKALGKDLLVADLPYAHETVGNYDRISFLPPVDAQAWAQGMSQIIANTWRPQSVCGEVPAAPFAENWAELWQLLTKGL